MAAPASQASCPAASSPCGQLTLPGPRPQGLGTLSTARAGGGQGVTPTLSAPLTIQSKTNPTKSQASPEKFKVYDTLILLLGEDTGRCPESQPLLVWCPCKECGRSRATALGGTALVLTQQLHSQEPVLTAVCRKPQLGQDVNTEMFSQHRRGAVQCTGTLYWLSPTFTGVLSYVTDGNWSKCSKRAEQQEPKHIRNTHTWHGKICTKYTRSVHSVSE